MSSTDLEPSTAAPTAAGVAPVPSPADALHRLLEQVPDSARGTGAWRREVRRQLGPLLDTLARPGGPTGDGLAARSARCGDDQSRLATRISALTARVDGDGETTVVCRDLRLLLADVRRHRQRCHDLAYDEVELELGGSE